MSIENTVPKLHADLGASNSERWRACKRSPSFINELKAAKLIPEQTTNFYAVEGTVAHLWGEQLLDPQERPNIFQAGQVVVQDGYEITCTDEMLEAVAVYVSYVSRRANERRLSLEKSLKLSDQLWGTADAEILAPYEFLEIVDYKHGSGTHVPVEYNSQMLYYLTAAFFMLPEDLQREVQELRTTVVQPRYFGNGKGISSCTYTKDFIEEFREQILLDASQCSESAPLVAGPHCKWCPAAQHCPELAKHVSNTMQMQLTLADKQEAARKLPPPLMPVEALSMNQILTIKENSQTIKDYLEAVDAHLVGLMQAGHDVPGYALKTNYGHGKWVNKTQCAEVFKQIVGDKAFTKPELLTPAKMRDLLFKESIECTNFDQLVSRSVSSYSLVKEDTLKPGERKLSAKETLELATRHEEAVAVK